MRRLARNSARRTPACPCKTCPRHRPPPRNQMKGTLARSLKWSGGRRSHGRTRRGCRLRGQDSRPVPRRYPAPDSAGARRVHRGTERASGRPSDLEGGNESIRACRACARALTISHALSHTLGLHPPHPPPRPSTHPATPLPTTTVPPTYFANLSGGNPISRHVRRRSQGERPERWTWE